MAVIDANNSFICILTTNFSTPQLFLFAGTAVAQAVRAFAPQAEGWVLESQPRQTYVVKTGFNSSTSTLLGDDHYKQMSRVTVSMAR